MRNLEMLLQAVHEKGSFTRVDTSLQIFCQTKVAAVKFTKDF